MSGSPSEVVSQRGVIANASSFFVLTLDIPFNVVFHAPAPLCTSTPAPDSVAPITSPPSRSATPSSATVAKHVDDRAVTRHKRHCDVMSRDRTPETVWRATGERGGMSGRSGQARCELSGSVGRVDALSRPRSLSVCAGKYCSVSRLQPLASSSTTSRTAGGVPLRPQSATAVRHPPDTSRRHQLSTAATGRIHVARQPVHNGVTVDDDDDVDSGVTSSVITSRDTSPRSTGSRDRQSQLRRFLDAASTSSSSSQHDQQHSDVTDDDDDVSESETRRASVCQWQDDEFHLYSSVKSDDQPASAMDQVRHLVARCRLPVCTSTERRVDAAQRQDAWTRTINHHSAHPSSVTSAAIQQAILGAATDLVRLSRVDERVASQLLTLSRRIQTYKLQLYSQHHRDVIESAARDRDDVQPAYVDLDVDRSELLACSHLVRCGFTRSHLQRRRRFSIF